jgi:hypothetical protein
MYGYTAHNRSVNASPPYGGSGYAKRQSGLRPFVAFRSATFFCARKNAPHFSLSGAKKRRLPPERYATYIPSIVDKILAI